ncbi:Adaptor complexes medium subunit family protein [Candida parapsilosis]|uniref:Adaptor complexes medium subunit family protein n=1 Tax=Candida parapsilosis TaxID=5480 RepID=A0A8X7NIK1_CANPA|nr:Adaptor complexes medium subunit family protein [Candida parapsilosis]KAF6044106.1 Adaptor complexes medium subunit family protein [Candida parapsilosis]KAF6045274.1 Adaptor complexes medium subunit family protein [Candida parapsilosis]KAF6060061.1 Adaptor complexes medium subunit family protein [Candida parapsilosis]KAI5901487.1 AP-3 complex subunit mu [Candida parapsilosis]
MIEAVYITDVSNTLIFEYCNGLSLPKYKTILPKITDIDSDQIGFENSSTNTPIKIVINSTYYVVGHKHQSLLIYVLCSEDKTVSNPLIPHTFITRFVETLQDYFDDLTRSKVEANTDIITLILYQMLDDGMPYITDFNKIRDSVSHTSLLSKIINEASKTTGLQPEVKQSFTTDIPWRRNNARHTNNEMYVDVIENVNMILKPIVTKSKREQYDSAFYSSKADNKVDNYVLSGCIDGQIDFFSQLSGTPTLELTLNKVGSNLEMPRFHRCINLDLFKERRGVLSFIPPEGKSTLMKYQFDLNELKSNREKTSLIKLSTIDVQFSIEPNSSEFEIKLFPANMITKVDFIKVEIVCEDVDDQVKINRISHGDFQTCVSGKHEWSNKDLKKGVVPTLNGTIIAEDNEEQEQPKGEQNTHKRPSYIKLNYSHKGPVPSGMKIDSLLVVNAKGLGENIKPYKGVKYTTKSGDYIVRA